MGYDYWNTALTEPAKLRARDFKVTSEPQPGFYRTKSGRPVAIWEDYDNADGAIVMTLGIEELPLREETALRVGRLPDIHGDPFDRLLVIQGISLGMTILTPDEAIRQYPVPTIW